MVRPCNRLSLSSNCCRSPTNQSKPCHLDKFRFDWRAVQCLNKGWEWDSVYFLVTQIWKQTLTVLTWNECSRCETCDSRFFTTPSTHAVTVSIANIAENAHETYDLSKLDEILEMQNSSHSRELTKIDVNILNDLSVCLFVSIQMSSFFSSLIDTCARQALSQD